MAYSLALITVLGLFANYVFEKIKIPGILGMLLVGILIGPGSFNWLHKDILTISSDLRQLALIVILLRAGLDLKLEDIKPVGFTAVKMSVIPALMEGFTIAVISMFLLGFTFTEGGMLGFIIAAVSPAVVVPAMIKLKKQDFKYANRASTVILAGASADDVVAITVFGAFLSIYMGQKVNFIMTVLNVPISIILGIVVAIACAYAIMLVYKKIKFSATEQILLLLFTGVGLTFIQAVLEGKIEMAALIGVMTMGFVIRMKMEDTAVKISGGLGHIWVEAKVILFVLVGAAVDIRVMGSAGITGLIIIVIGLCARSIGVFIATLGSPLTKKERIFCTIAYLPKATVQAAIGGLPLINGAANGQLILAIAVLSIIVCAPVGAVGISVSAPKLLNGE